MMQKIPLVFPLEKGKWINKGTVAALTDRSVQLKKVSNRHYNSPPFCYDRHEAQKASNHRYNRKGKQSCPGHR